MSSDLFGNAVIESSGIGEQCPLFHHPVTVQATAIPSTAADRTIAKRFDEAETPQFPYLPKKMTRRQFDLLERDLDRDDLR